MERRTGLILTTLAALGLLAASSATAAVAQTAGPETLRATLVVSGASGGRTLLTDHVVLLGALDAVGRVVEVPNLPGDGDAVLRDDIVLPGGVIHLVSESGAASFRLDPRTCVFADRVEQTTRFAGGTGRFSAATGAL